MNIRQSIPFFQAKRLLNQITDVGQDVAELWLERWLEPHRYYHTFDHLVQMWEDLGERAIEPNVFLTTVFHDIIYDPTRNDNEERSRDFFLEQMPSRFAKANPELMHAVATAIMETKHNSPPESTLGKLICEVDLRVLTHNDLDGLIAYERKLCKEFQSFPHEQYREGRIQFLSKWVEVNPNIAQLIDFVRYRRMNIGIYAGSFDPFTVGHQNILHKAERIFDKVIIARGLNPAKNNWTYKLPACLNFHEKILVGAPPTSSYETIVHGIDGYLHLAHAMKQHPGAVLVRGLRGSADLETEKVQQIYVERMMKGEPIDTVYITCDREFDHISSTAFKQLAKVDPEQAATCCPDGFPSELPDLRPA